MSSRYTEDQRKQLRALIIQLRGQGRTTTQIALLLNERGWARPNGSPLRKLDIDNQIREVRRYPDGRGPKGSAGRRGCYCPYCGEKVEVVLVPRVTSHEAGEDEL